MRGRGTGKRIAGWLAAGFAGFAGVAFALSPQENEPAGKADAATPAERPPIERSLILVPEQAGDFRLVKFEGYPGRPEMGVGARYAHPEFPEVVLDIYIYPVGAFARDAALDGLVDAMRNELRTFEADGGYEQLEFGDPVDIDLQRVDADGTLGAVRAGLLGVGGEMTIDTERAKTDLEGAMADELPKVEKTVRDATDPDIGRRLPIRFRHDGVERRSVSFLFHRSLYAFKARVSTHAGVDPDSFDRLANRAMADIVPKTAVRNVGGCSEMSVGAPQVDDRNVGALLLAANMQVAVVRAERDGCGKTLDETVPDGMRGELLDVAGIWRR